MLLDVHLVDARQTMKAPKLIISMYFSAAPNAGGGVFDVARNVIAGLSVAGKGRDIIVLSPSAAIQGGKAGRRSSLIRFFAEIWLGFRYFFSPVVLLFPNYFCLPIPGARSKTVVVVHDIMFKRFPQYVSPAKQFILDLSYRIVAKFAHGVIFISKDSERDFIRSYGEPRAYTTIYNPVVLKGASPDTVRTVGPIGRPYIIANFHYYPHKNLPGLLRVFAAIQQQWPELQLIFTGNRTPEFDAALAACPAREHVAHLGYLPKDQVLAVVRDATFFMSMSQFEGFNMSAAEAALQGKPLVLSRLPVHEELFSDCAFFVDGAEDSLDTNSLINFVKGYVPKEPAFAMLVKPEYAAAQYLAFSDKVARRS